MAEGKNLSQNQGGSLCISECNVQRNERVEENNFYSQFLKSQSENSLSPHDLLVRNFSELLLLLKYNLLLVRRLDGTIEVRKVMPYLL